MQIAPDGPLGYNRSGRIKWTSGSLAEAVEWYEQALQAAPDDPRSKQELGLVMVDLGFYEEAEALLGEQRYAVYMAQGRMDEALALIHAELAERPADSRIIIATARTEMRAGNLDLTQALLEPLQVANEPGAGPLFGSLNPIFWDPQVAALDLAVALLQNGDKEAGIQLLGEVRDHFERLQADGFASPMLSYQEARILAVEGDLENALAVLRKTIAAGFRCCGRAGLRATAGGRRRRLLRRCRFGPFRRHRLGFHPAGLAASMRHHCRQYRQGDFFRRTRRNRVTRRCDDATDRFAVETCADQRFAHDGRFSPARYERDLHGVEGKRGFQSLQVATALGRHNHVGTGRNGCLDDFDTVVDQHLPGIRVVHGLGPATGNDDLKSHSGAQLGERNRDGRRADHQQLLARQHRVDEQLQRTARMAGHPELEYVGEVALAGIGRRNTNHPRPAIGQQSADCLDDRGLRAATAHPRAPSRSASARWSTSRISATVTLRWRSANRTFTAMR